MGDTVRLRILSTDMSQKIPCLVGNLIDPPQEQDGAKSKKRKHHQISSEAETQESEDQKDILIKSITEKVRKKRKTK
jgi:predicted RNA-binding protein with RPS1 domain